MPKFVSGSSGHIYAHDKITRDEEEDEIAAVLKNAASASSTDTHNYQKEAPKKPSAINKKGAKEKQKNSLDLFKEELRRLTEEREEQRNKLKKSISSSSTSVGQSERKSQYQPVPVPLKPDPRCPTALTLQVNLNPKDRDTLLGGSFDNGDPTTTNLYVGNVNPTVNENDLCDVFGKFGPLASIKIMWPRTDEERARNRNSGFVAYMSRIDAERALAALNGIEFRGYDMKLGWGKAVPLPQNPVYIPPELLKLTQPPPQSGLPFNGQLHESDIASGYIVPRPYPRPLPPELEAQADRDPAIKAQKEAYERFRDVVGRSTVKVIIPQDRLLLDRIHKFIEYVIREGPVFEAIMIARESKNAAFTFLHDNCSPEHIYYRWKLYSLLHGDNPYEWRTDEFKMFHGGATWKPPPLNPFADGMPPELVEKVSTSLRLQSNSSSSLQRGTLKRVVFSEGPHLGGLFSQDQREKGTLGEFKREFFGDMLRNLDPTRKKIGSAMMFCIGHADAAQEIIDCIYESLLLLETPFQRKIARLFLISDILHNCSASVTNASYYRKGFQVKLVSIFEHLREYLINIEDRHKADKFKQKTLSVLGAWKEWTLYEDELVIQLSNILLGINTPIDEQKGETASGTEITGHAAAVLGLSETQPMTATTLARHEDDLDGEPVDEETLSACLEAKGLSLRWYMTLDLSGDEAELSTSTSATDNQQRGASSHGSSYAEAANRGNTSGTTSAVADRFKASKWETVDPDEVAGQVVTLSTIVSQEDFSGTTTSLSEDSDKDHTKSAGRKRKFSRTKKRLNHSDGGGAHHSSSTPSSTD